MAWENVANMGSNKMGGGAKEELAILGETFWEKGGSCLR